MFLTDSDSLMHKIEAGNIYVNFYKVKKLFNFSNYPRNSKYYNKGNNLVIGKMRDETFVVPLKSFLHNRRQS